jgi:predicted exporter
MGMTTTMPREVEYKVDSMYNWIYLIATIGVSALTAFYLLTLINPYWRLEVRTMCQYIRWSLWNVRTPEWMKEALLVRGKL